MEFKDYEANFEQLKEIVKKLETGDLSLDENMACYKQGMQLHRELEACLKRSRGELTRIEGESEIPFSQEGSDDGLSDIDETQ